MSVVTVYVRHIHLNILFGFCQGGGKPCRGGEAPARGEKLLRGPGEPKHSLSSNSGMSPHPPWGAGPALLWGRSVTVCLVLLVSPTQGQAPLHAQVPGSVSSLRGQVLEHETGMPLAGAAVSLASGPGGTEGIGTRVTNAEGRFLFRRVPPGTYRVIVTLIGYRDLQDTLRVDRRSQDDHEAALCAYLLRQSDTCRAQM